MGLPTRYTAITITLWNNLNKYIVHNFQFYGNSVSKLLSHGA